MVSPIIRFAENFNRPFLHFIIKKGWYIRLKKKKYEKKDFNKVDRQTKKEIKKFWKQYKKHVSSDWAAYFSSYSKKVDIKVIPESLYYGEILKSLNDQRMGTGLSDKNMYDLIFDTNQPETLFRRSNGILLNKNFEPIEKSEVLDICSQRREVILKPSNETYGGSGIFFWTVSDGEEELLKYISNNKNMICQEVAKQHEFFENIHPESLNTLRMVTMILDDEIVLLSTILRMGKNKSKVDNYSAGGIICPVDKNGVLFDTSVQSDGEVLYKHPDGFEFKGKKIPHFNEIVKEAKKLHYVIPYFKIISWDFTLDSGGNPLFIEGNYPSGQLDLHQLNIGSIFGEYTDRVLSDVYSKKR
ncbi:sugar-transfer associated ATP-grasp domain-containing protein [Enterococcus devriesei]|uniref:sugar-transfer associated ATP-grasp domain-containing protein n=1 Tax=Enterococcus devriesei TaxID=319970 RepID=UPI0036D33ABA